MHILSHYHIHCLAALASDIDYQNDSTWFVGYGRSTRPLETTALNTSQNSAFLRNISGHSRILRFRVYQKFYNMYSGKKLYTNNNAYAKVFQADFG